MSDIERKILEDYIGEYLTSKTHRWVVFNSNAEIEYEGPLVECVAFVQSSRCYAECRIYSREAYDELVNRLKQD